MKGYLHCSAFDRKSVIPVRSGTDVKLPVWKTVCNDAGKYLSLSGRNVSTTGITDLYHISSFKQLL